jgi:hypothetical protein
MERFVKDVMERFVKDLMELDTWKDRSSTNRLPRETADLPHETMVVSFLQQP